jgi:hypothetical protein
MFSWARREIRAAHCGAASSRRLATKGYGWGIGARDREPAQTAANCLEGIEILDRVIERADVEVQSAC